MVRIPPETGLLISSNSVITTGRGLTSGWTSTARLPGRAPVPGGLFKSRNLEGYTTAMNVSQRESLGADGIMANDNLRIGQEREAANHLTRGQRHWFGRRPESIYGRNEFCAGK
jgi:hypothetical protein